MLSRRPYGSDGVELSIVGFGAIVVMDATPDEAKERVAWAVRRGVNYFDVAPSYGNAEERLGPALAPWREEVFLACKTTRRDAEGASEELQNSLRTLQTDRLDLYQLHALTTEQDVDAVFAPGGAMETFQRARDNGQVRFLGFSAHSDEAAVMAMERFDFDSLLFPVNYATLERAGFGRRALQVAGEKGVARLALKAMARGRWEEGAERRWAKTWYEPHDTERELELALRWTLSQDVSAALPPGEWDLFRKAVRVAAEFRPISPEETNELLGQSPDAVPVFK